MTVVDLDGTWLSACLSFDQRVLDGFWTEAQWQRELEDPRRLCLGLVEKCRLQGVACGWLVVDELHITVIAVDLDHRQRGVGTHLLRALLQRARREGAAHATLEVSSDNDPALALYRRAGFHTAGCRQNYYRNGQDALVQWLRLPQESHI